MQCSNIVILKENVHGESIFINASPVQRSKCNQKIREKRVQK